MGRVGVPPGAGHRRSRGDGGRRVWVTGSRGGARNAGWGTRPTEAGFFNPGGEPQFMAQAAQQPPMAVQGENALNQKFTL
jgi:hypothetical protein